MNRREFIKSAGVAAALPAIAITCKYEDDEKGEKEALWKRWDYVVYCYERGQGEWTFSQNTRGSFAYQREYMTFEEEDSSGADDFGAHKLVPIRSRLQGGGSAVGWMDGGKLHFTSLEEACDFVEMHVRAKEDVNLIDSIYDIYYIKRETKTYADAAEITETEIHAAHYWFNGDTGRQIQWVTHEPSLGAGDSASPIRWYTDLDKVESG